MEVKQFETKDSGERQEFPTGGVRDTEVGKPRYDLLSPFALTRLANLMARGALKYKSRNWEAGLDVSRCFSSGFRHLMQWYMGDRSEDHLAAVLFNISAIIHFEELGREDLDDMPKWK